MGASGDDPRALAERYFAAFARHDWAAMGACYADDARFHDPVFLDLDAADARLMWRMLLEPASDLSVSAAVLEADADHAEVAWTATYTFTATGRRVRNQVRTHLVVREGRIWRQVDTFSLWRWAGMALGASGWLLGWTVFVRGKVRDRAGARLDAFRARAQAASG